MSLPEEQPQIRRRTNRPQTEEQGSPSFLVDSYGKPSQKVPTHRLPSDDNLVTEDPPRQSTSVVRLTGPNTTTQRALVSSPARQVSQRRPTQDIPQRAMRAGQHNPTREQAAEPKKTGLFKRVHWLLPLGIGMVAMLVLFMLASVLSAWGAQRLDDLHYGNPRTFQTDKFVGNGDSAVHPSHFIAMNLNRQAIVIQFIGGDPTKSSVYVAPFYIGGESGDKAPVTVDFRNVTNHADGKLDMVITIHLTQNQVFVFVNNGNGFRAPTGDDKIHLS